ncbi:Pentatricopeptide repeat-containing protein [Thalictrum thalictroides]|uniref:Pentatricopeptide repeat-containing protein n=1 Tax=Thalictrum thalictroides TaxID=46969 RepID=A0A7J6V8I7_THATH|nr:Pentatricopeptide repeat-containing protein [Thalictrum thalictroides]
MFHGSVASVEMWNGDGFICWDLCLVDLYGKCREIECARKVFDGMLERNEGYWYMEIWNAMIGGYVKFGHLRKARKLFDKMAERNLVSFTLLIDGYAKAGDLHLDENVRPAEFIMVNLMSACSQISGSQIAECVDSYVAQNSIDLHGAHVVCALVNMHAKCGNMDRATNLFKKMPLRDLISYCSMIQGLSIHGHGEEAVQLFARMLEEGLRPDK